MNFLAHYLADHIPNDHYHNTGLILPDITRGFVSGFRNAPPNGSPPEFEGFFSGCSAHYKSDKIFHGSNFFHKYQEKTNDLLKSSGFGNSFSRKWFISHVIIELFLDRMIIKTDESIADAFYDTLSKTKDSILESYLLAYDCEDVEGFMEKYKHFRSVKYIYHYRNNNKFVYSLNRIMLRAGLKGLNEPDVKLLEELPTFMESSLISSPQDFIDEFREIFK